MQNRYTAHWEHIFLKDSEHAYVKRGRVRINKVILILSFINSWAQG